VFLFGRIGLGVRVIPDADKVEEIPAEDRSVEIESFKADATIARKSSSSLLLSALSYLYAITCHCLPRAQTTQSF